MNAAALACAPSGTSWDGINWADAQRRVKGLQARIVKAVQDGRHNKAKALQWLLTHSFSGKALAVKRVSENKGKNTPGVDKVTWNTPRAKIGAIASLKRRGYSPLPLRRVLIPKKNGKTRPLGIPAMKCRAMQALHLLALEPIAETTADPNSYGFRPERSTADAAAQCFGVLSRKANAEWVLEGDIQGCFDNISHDWLIAHIPMDKAILQKWLKAGYVYRNELFPSHAGTPQGGIISPLLANIYLHYVLDLWARQWRQRHARGDVIVVRYADDSVVGFRTKVQAQQFLVQLQERLARFGLSLNASKIRLIEFGRFAARNCRKRGLGKPETFDFLGFTHCCSTNRSGGFQILRLTVKKRMRATLLAIRNELKRRRHEPVRVVGQWLNRVVSGYFNYHAVPGNLIRLGGFRLAVCRLWRQALKRRSQRNRLQWSRYGRLADLYIPRPRNAHPYPEDRFASRTQGRSRGSSARTDLCGGRQVTVVPTATRLSR
ncbi:hypothetical protein PS900_06111 [Pseudomonas fluorescens]|uniref:Reverse transcriptase domain-containing protein n=1 Tax=Pseudomonas fluorescens TaxID=294 RepID=A0A8H2NY55_PSEFL|nr:group II intron reverse transcriptase/maturase [Pseudomonas fluorescens]VVP59787.1 hypothetical protein PS900_06111 [Pseudomonas fluorescens]